MILPKFKTTAAQLRYAREQGQFKDDPVMERHAHSTESRLRQYEKEPTEILYRMLQKDLARIEAYLKSTQTDNGRVGRTE